MSVEIDAGVSQVFRSLDGGNSWSAWGSALNELNAVTLDITGARQSSLYVSGVAQNETVEGVRARSVDDGESWSLSRCPVRAKSARRTSPRSLQTTQTQCTCA